MNRIQVDMRHLMNKWMTAAALLVCAACSKNDFAIDNARPEDENGVFGEIMPIIFDDATDTRASVNPTNMAYQWETGDEINIWSSSGTLLVYEVTQVSGNRATFDGGGYTLTDGETYYSSHPLIRSVRDKYKNLPTPYTGQVQTADGNADHIAEYMYTYASATCNDQKTSFDYHHFTSFMLIEATLPKTMTVTEVSVIANKSVFALNGTSDVTTGVFTPGTMSNTLTLALDNVEVTDGVLNAFLATAPLEPATYILSVKDSEGTVYTSPEIVKKKSLDAGHGTYFRGTVEGPERNYELVTSMTSAGKYILVYPNGNTYRAFSFTKAMENAEDAGELAKDTHGLENILQMGSQLYATVVANNCIDINVEGGTAIAESLILTPDKEKEAAFEVSLQDEYHRWGTVDGKVTFSTTTEKGNTYSIGVDHAVVNVNGNADVVVAFNAPDVINAVKAIRGTDLPVDFDYLIDVAVAQAMKEGITFTPAQISRLKSGFEHLCVLAKSMVASHPEVFQGGTLMDINLSTNVFDVIGRYYDNATQMSWAIAPQKRFGLATLGYHAYDKGFTFNVGLPQAGWFNRLEASLKNDLNNDGVLQVEECVTYWKQFDSQYSIPGIPNFFERASRRALSELDPSTLAMLQQMAAAGKFAAIGNVYKQYADRFNDELEPVYIYKKVE